MVLVGNRGRELFHLLVMFCSKPGGLGILGNANLGPRELLLRSKVVFPGKICKDK